MEAKMARVTLVAFGGTSPYEFSIAASGVVYTLFLYEIPAGEDPQAVINSGLAAYRTIETTQPYYSYDVSEVPLNLGYQYAWMVHVTDFEGSDTFVNSGYSEVKTFQYGKAKCDVASNLISHVEPDGAVKLSWDANTDAQSYLLRYWVKDGPIQEEEILSNEHYLLNQEKGKSYNWQVICKCGVDNKSAKVEKTFSIPADELLSWQSDPTLTYESESYTSDPANEPILAATETADLAEQIVEASNEGSEGEKTAMVNIDDILKAPIQILVPAEGQENLPANVQSTLPVLPADASVESLQAALKTQKPICAGIVYDYACGIHDALPTYTGSLVPITAGDEIAMNSVVLSVVKIDGDGNGLGLIKVPMMNNIKVGVNLSGIKVAEGGCIVAGRADLNGVGVSLLTDQQKAELTNAYNILTTITQKAIENAGVVAETYNSVAELLSTVRQKANTLIDKINANIQPSNSELKKLKQLAKTAIEIKEKELKAVNDQSVNIDYRDSLEVWLNKQKSSLACLESTDFSQINKASKNGPAQQEEFFFVECDLSGLTLKEPEEKLISPIHNINDPILAKVFTNVNLNETELSDLENQFQEFYKQPENQIIYNFLVEKGVKLKLVKDEIFGLANYNRTKKAIVFPKSDPRTSIQNLQHELFHAYQDQIYPNLGLYSKGKKGFINIEFEVAFMQFLLFNVAPKSNDNFIRFDENKPIAGSHLDELNKWTKDRTSSYTRYPSIDLYLEEYYKFMKYFGVDKPQYYSQINDKLEPLALIHFIEQLQK
jgi:hypothetical protein